MIGKQALRGYPSRKTALRAGTAMLLVFAASTAHAQCADPTANSGGAFGLPKSFGLPAASVVSGVQSLTSVLTTQNTAFLTQTSAFIGAPANPPAETNGGGVWIRGTGGTFDTNTPGNYTRFPSLTAPGVSASCNVKTFQDYVGFQSGADISRLNINGYNIHTGVTMGYTDSSVRSSGSFAGTFQTPFVGVYGAVTKDTFFADAQVRWDFIQGTLNDPANTLTNQRLDARSFSVTGNVGYQIPMSDGWFVEPSAGAVYAEVTVDPLKSAGGLFLANPTVFSAPNTVKIKDFDSILARGSVRIGRNFTVENYAVQPFITASVINEFGGPVRTDVSTDFRSFGAFFGPAFGLTPAQGAAALSGLDQRARINTYRIGTYGQFSGGIAGQLLNTGWLGYVRGDYRVGDRVEGWGVSGGLRYQFTPENAARPLVTKGDSPIFAPLGGPVNWTSVSFGGSVGSLWGEARQTVDFFGTTALPHFGGVYAGGQIGADYQLGNVVVGVAGDAGYTGAEGGRNCTENSIRGNFLNCQTNIHDLYMATGRVGYTIFDRTLVYAKGGAAFAHTSDRAQENLGGRAFFDGSVIPESEVRAFRTGWTVGAGFEYALTKNWSAKAEYMHFDLGSRSPALTPSNLTFVKVSHEGELVKVGVNYRFAVEPVATAPVAARY